MTDETKDLEFYKARPERYRILESGAVVDTQTARMVANFNSKFAITKDNARAMLQRRKEVGILAQMRGLAKAQGLDLPPDVELEEVIRGAGSAVEALTAHMAKTFLESKNLRGMGETYGRLTSNMVESEPESEYAPLAHDSDIEILREILHAAKAVREISTAEREIIDVLPTG